MPLRALSFERSSVRELARCRAVFASTRSTASSVDADAEAPVTSDARGVKPNASEILEKARAARRTRDERVTASARGRKQPFNVDRPLRGGGAWGSGGAFAYGGERVSARTSAELNREIMDAQYPEEILEHVRVRSHLYNRVNCATAWHRLGRTSRVNGRPRGWTSDERVAELEATTRRLMSTFAVQNLTNIAWACAVLKYKPRDDLLGSIAARMGEMVAEFYPQALSNALWAYTVLKHPRAFALAEALKPVILATLPENPDDELKQAESAKDGVFSTQTVSNVLWTYATLGVHPGVELLDRLAAFILKSAGSFKAQELSNSCWSYARFGHYPGDEVLQTFERCLLERREEYTTQALANTSVGLSYFGGSGEGGLRKLFDDIPPSWFRLREGNSQDISNIVWAIASVGAFESQVYKAAVRELFRRDVTDFQDEGLKALFHARLMQHDFAPDKDEVDVVYPDWVADKGLKPWLEQAEDTRVSTFQQNVTDAVKRAGYEPTMEALTEDGLLSMDICLNDKKLAIECDGPTHFYSNAPEKMTQKTLIRNRHLEVRGWKVIMIPYYEWREVYVAGDLETKAYVTKKIRETL